MMSKVSAHLLCAAVGLWMAGWGQVAAAQGCFPSNDYLRSRTVGIHAVGWTFGSGVLGNQQGDGASLVGVEWDGSGFLVGEDGTLLTNWHVARHMLKGVASFDTGASYPITFVKSYNPVHDLAMLKLNADQGFPTVKLGDSDEVDVRDPVMVVGNAGGRGINITEGKVTQITRDDYRKPLFINHDATQQGGNSGGPLFRCDQVIGVISAGWLEAGQKTGFNIAVPINRAKGMFEPQLWGHVALLEDVFSPNGPALLNRAQHENGWTGSVNAGTSDQPAAAWVDYPLQGLTDYLILLEAPVGVDLDLVVVDVGGNAIGWGATAPAPDQPFEPLFLSVDQTQPVRVFVQNANATPSNFGLSIHRIVW